MPEKGRQATKQKEKLFCLNKKYCAYKYIFMLISGYSEPRLRNLSTSLLDSFNRMVQTSICHDILSFN
jgi:hypothetical protein